MPDPLDQRLLEDYKIHVGALEDHYSRLWTRFSFFLTINSALLVALVGLFKDTHVRWSALPLALLGVLISAIWYLTGAQDRYLVRFYREMITFAARRLAPDDTDWPHPGLESPVAIRYLAQAKRPPNDPHTESDAQVLGLAPSVWQWRAEHLSVTKLPALIPLVVGVLWVVAAIRIGIAADGRP